MTLRNTRKQAYSLEEREWEILLFLAEQAKRARVITYEEYLHSSGEQYFERLNCVLPATTEDLVKLTELPSSTVSDIMMKLRRQKKVKSRKAHWFTRELRLYIPYHFSWPDYLFKTCGSCENWNRFTGGCTFFQELDSYGYPTDRVRLIAKLPHSILACKWHIPRIRRALRTFQTIQEFAAEAGDTELWFDSRERDNNYLTSPHLALVAYRCLFCKRPMPELGWGMLPNIGNSLLICKYCGAFYKLWFNRDEQVYGVKVAEEQYHEYSKKYQIYTRGEEPKPFAAKEQYGISLVELSEENLLYDISMLATHNIYAHYCQLNFLVVNTQEELELLQNKVGASYPRMMFYVREKPLESIEPTKQQLGAVGLLRETEVLNFDYGLALLGNRRTSLEQITEFANKKVLAIAYEEISETINDLLGRNRQGKTLSIEEWNRIDGRAANQQWDVIKRIFEEHHFGFPNRRKARHTERDPIRPHGKYFSFSKGNTAVNGIFRKIDTAYIKTCIEHRFPWDGLPGICHNKTTGGIYGFLLDNEEGFKQPALPAIVKAVADEIITPDMIHSIRLRKRIPQYFLIPGSEGDMILDEISQKVLREQVVTRINGKEQRCSIRRAMDYQVLGVKQLLEDIIWNEKLQISGEQRHYCAWTVGEEKRWKDLSWKEQQRIQKIAQQVIVQAKEYF